MTELSTILSEIIDQVLIPASGIDADYFPPDWNLPNNSSDHQIMQYINLAFLVVLAKNDPQAMQFIDRLSNSAKYQSVARFYKEGNQHII